MGERLEAPSHASTEPVPRATTFFAGEGGMSASRRTPSCDKGVAVGFGLSVGVGDNCLWILRGNMLYPDKLLFVQS